MWLCVVLHNMVIDNKQELNLEVLFDPNLVPRVNMNLSFRLMLEGIIEIQSTDTYFSLRANLIEHLWRLNP